jgi:hypothetical protein
MISMQKYNIEVDPQEAVDTINIALEKTKA